MKAKTLDQLFLKFGLLANVSRTKVQEKLYQSIKQELKNRL